MTVTVLTGFVHVRDLQSMPLQHNTGFMPLEDKIPPRLEPGFIRQREDPGLVTQN